MSYGEATLYGLVQGLSEFLPISSSAHLALLPRLLGRPDQGLAFDVALHMGTLAAVLVYFRADWLALLRGALAPGPQRRRLSLLVLGTAPAVLAGLAFKDAAETMLRGPVVIASSLIVFGILLGAADRFGGRSRELESVGGAAALLIGVAQACAIVPGVSRSGATITAARALGFEPGAAARFSFLLAAPVTAGAAVLKLRDLGAEQLTGPFFWAVLVSGLSGAAAVHFLLGWLRTRSLLPYAVYRVALGLVVLSYL